MAWQAAGMMPQRFKIRVSTLSIYGYAATDLLYINAPHSDLTLLYMPGNSSPLLEFASENLLKDWVGDQCKDPARREALKQHFRLADRPQGLDFSGLDTALDNALANNWSYTGHNLSVDRQIGGSLQLDCTVSPVLAEDARILLEFRPIDQQLRIANEELSGALNELRGYESQMRRIHELSQLLMVCADRAEAYEVMQRVFGALLADRPGYFAVLEPQTHQLLPAFHWGGGELVEAPIPVDDCWAMRRGEPHLMLVALLVPTSIAATNVYRGLHMPRDLPDAWLSAATLVGSALLLAALAPMVQQGTVRLADRDGAVWLLLQTFALVTGYLCYFALQRRAEPVAFSLIGYVMMLVSVGIGTSFFGETVAWTLWPAILLIGSALSGEHLQAMPPLEGWLALAYLTVFGSIIAFTAYVWLLHHARPVLVGSYAYVNPVIAVALGAFIAGETFTAHDLGAMAVILCGVVVITLARARQSK